MVGFDAHGGFSHAVCDGWVICAEMKETVIAAYIEDEREANRKLAEKKQERVLANWKRLIKTVLIREQLNLKYETFQTKKPVKHSKQTKHAQPKPEAIKIEEDDFDEEKRNMVGGKLNTKLTKNEEAEEGFKMKESNSDLLKLTKKNAIVTKKKAATAAQNGRTKRAKKAETESEESYDETNETDSSDPEHDYKKVMRTSRRTTVKNKNLKEGSESESVDSAAKTSTSSKSVPKRGIKDDGEINLSEDSDVN